jgi:dTDP-4-dehydrorhamnose reductase
MPPSGYRILVTGTGGQVGGALVAAGRAAGLTLLPMGRGELDLAATDSVRRVLERADPDLVVNCAAYTAVDQAEQEAELAFRVNGEAPGILAGWCAERQRPLIHLSTDYVFPGNGVRPYREDDPIGPSSAYGASKAEGERTVRAAGGRHVILRTAWVYAATGKNFVRTMLRLGAERDNLAVVADQKGCPTAAHSIAQGLLAVIERLAAGDVVTGTYHYVDSGETTWHGLAERIFEVAARQWGRRPAVKAITTEEYPTPARRPAYSVLATARFQATFGVVPPAWQDSLDRVLAEIFTAG